MCQVYVEERDAFYAAVNNEGLKHFKGPQGESSNIVWDSAGEVHKYSWHLDGFTEIMFQWVKPVPDANKFGRNGATFTVQRRKMKRMTEGYIGSKDSSSMKEDGCHLQDCRRLHLRGQ